MKPLCVTIQMKTIVQYSHVILFMLYKVVLTLKSVDETLVCKHSNESYLALLSCCIVYYALQGGSNFLSLWMLLRYKHICSRGYVIIPDTKSRL